VAHLLHATPDPDRSARTQAVSFRREVRVAHRHLDWRRRDGAGRRARQRQPQALSIL